MPLPENAAGALRKGEMMTPQSLNLLWLEIAGVCWFCSENMEHGLKPRGYFFFSTWWFQTYSFDHMLPYFSWINVFFRGTSDFHGFSMFFPMDFPMKYGGFVYQKPCHPVIQSSRQGQGSSAWVGALDDRFETCGLRFSTYIYIYIYTYISHLKYRYHRRYDLCIYIYTV